MEYAGAGPALSRLSRISPLRGVIAVGCRLSQSMQSSATRTKVSRWASFVYTPEADVSFGV